MAHKLRRTDWHPHDPARAAMPLRLRRRTRVDVMREDGRIDVDMIACAWNWGRGYGFPPIMAYRLTRALGSTYPLTRRP